MRIKIEQPKINIKAGVAKITPNAESLEITPSKDAQSYQGLYDNVSVSGDNNLIAENIKKDVSIFGVEGDYEPETDTLSITPTAQEQSYEGLYSSVSVAGDEDLTAGNIKKDVSIFGITGIFEGEVPPLVLTDDIKFGYSTFVELPETIKNADTSSVTNLSSMFQGCNTMTSADISGWNTSNVTSANNMFSGCRNLKQIPVFDTSKIRNAMGMFYGCNAITSFPLLDIGTMSSMNSFLTSCSNLIDLPELDTRSASNFSYAFSGCPKLSEESLNNILAMCAKSRTKQTLLYVGLTQAQAETCTTLPNYQAFLDAGWTTGY